MWFSNNMIYTSCSQLGFIHWLQDHLIRCPFKYLTGIDCPGCGFQRSLIALMQGDFSRSFSTYPPTIPLLLLFVYGIADAFFKLDTPAFLVKKTLFIVTGNIVLISYFLKMWYLYGHAAY